MKAAILAGGLGKRLRPFTDQVPKPLLEVAGRPILVWQFDWLRKHGIEEVVICAGYLREKIMDLVGSGSKFGVRVGYVIEDEPLGKGGALMNARHLLETERNFVVLNGDVLTNLDPIKLVSELHENAIGCVAVTPMPSPYGVVEFQRDSALKAVPTSGWISTFTERPVLGDHWINAGVYSFTNEVFAYLPEKGEIEETTFPKLIEKTALKAVPFNDVKWISIDSHKDLEEASSLVAEISV